MATVPDDAWDRPNEPTLAVSRAHLHRSIRHYQQLLSDCLADSEPSQQRMVSVYRVLERERRALLMAVEDGCPDRCLDYLELISDFRDP